MIPLRSLLLAALAAAVLAPPAGASASGIVISELRFRGPAGAGDEFVELANVGPTSVDVSGWKLQGCAAASSSASTRLTVPAGTALAPGEHLLLVNARGYSGSVAGDGVYAVGFSDTGGARLVDADGGVVDQVGSAAQPDGGCREGTGLEFPAVDADASFARLDGDARDTDDNAADFALGASDPENAASRRPTLAIADVTVAEGSAGTTEATVTVSLSAPARRPVTVAFATADGTATAGDDYVAKSGALAFAPGETEQALALSIVGDSVDEPNEAFHVELSTPTDAVVARARATVTIRDDDEPVDMAASTPGSVFAAGRLGHVVLMLAVRYDAGAERPSGRLLVLARGLLLVSRSFSLLQLGEGRAAVAGTASAGGDLVRFRLELVTGDGGARGTLSWPGHAASGRLRGVLRIARARAAGAGEPAPASLPQV